MSVPTVRTLLVSLIKLLVTEKAPIEAWSMSSFGLDAGDFTRKLPSASLKPFRSVRALVKEPLDNDRLPSEYADVRLAGILGPDIRIPFEAMDNAADSPSESTPLPLADRECPGVPPEPVRFIA